MTPPALADPSAGEANAPASPFPYTDAGNAERFAARYADTARFVHGPNFWVIWDGSRWAPDDMREARRLAKESARSLYAEGLEMDSAGLKALVRHVAYSERRSSIDSALVLASSEPPLGIVPTALDANPNLLNVENGTIDLRTGQLLPHRPEDLISKLAPVAYDSAATAPRFDAFLERVIPDAEVRAYLQRAVGYGLTGSVAEHALFFLYGTGRNGKSTFLELMLDLLGDYGKSAPPDLLLATRQDSHPTEVATLMGFRFVIAIEAKQGRAWDEEKVKRLTGGDTISARWMYGNYFTFRPVHKFWWAANHKPRVSGTDLGFWRRVNLIPWTVEIPAAERDLNLPAKLREEMPGILRWAVEGALAWRRDGLRPPRAVVEATKAYRSAEDVLGAFLDECTVPGDRVDQPALFDEYRRWAERGGEHRVMTARALGEALEERGLERVRSHGRTWVLGLSLRSPGACAPDADSTASAVHPNIHQAGIIFRA